MSTGVRGLAVVSWVGLVLWWMPSRLGWPGTLALGLVGLFLVVATLNLLFNKHGWRIFRLPRGPERLPAEILLEAIRAEAPLPP